MTGARAIAIGAGFGGLAAALRARALGYEVVLLERLEELGGRARSFERDGFRFDCGPTVITAPFLLAELFTLFGETMSAHVDLVPLDPYYRILFADGRHFDLCRDADRMRDQVREFSPSDVAGYTRLLERSARLYEVGYLRYGTQRFDRLRTMLAALPGLAQLGGFRSVHGLVGRFIKNEHLRRAFSLQPLLVGGHPFRTTGIYALIGHLERLHGVWYARGGTAAIVTALGELARRHGVAIRFGADVTKLVVTRRRVAGVQLAGGETLTADIVIANADPPTLYGEMLAGVARRRWTQRRLDRLHYSMGLFVLYFGTNRQYPDVQHHTILLGEQYRALLDEVFGTRTVLSDDPSLYLHRPTATDPSLAPAGCDSFYALAPVPNLRAPIDWPAAAPRLRDRLVACLEDRLLPGLSRAIVTEHFVTPRNFATDYRSRHGAGFSVAPLLRQSAWFRFHNKSEEAENLYLVGAGTHPGAGLPGVLTSAKVVEAILRQQGPLARQG